MIVLGIDPSLRMTGLVLAEATKSEIVVIRTATIETRPCCRALKGMSYEADVMARNAYLFQGIKNFVHPLNLNLIICESVPFARGWKSGVASNSMKGMIGSLASELCYDLDSIELVDPKRVKKDVSLGKEHVHKHSDIINGAEHKQKDFVLAFFLESAKFRSQPQTGYSRLQYEAIADAYSVLYSWWWWKGVELK